MIRIISLLCALLFAGAPALSAEIAVLPYKIIDASVDFPESMGEEYSRLVTVASLLMKRGIDPAPPRETAADLDRLKLSPGGLITREDLDALGRTTAIDYYMLGSLSRSRGRYRAESVLYSIRDRRVLTRTRIEDSDLFRLAARDVSTALASFPDRKREEDQERYDVLFLLDLSYRMNADWRAVKDAIAALSARLIDYRGVDTRIYIVPFSDRLSYSSGSVSVNSITSVKNELDTLKPAGKAGGDDFLRTLRYAVNNVTWRSGAVKRMILISNSDLGSRGVEYFGLEARKKGIAIDAVSLGRAAGDRSEAADRLAEISGGFHANAAYHQRLFNAEGEAVEAYLENGRLFRSRTPEREWRRGLYESAGPETHYGKPRQFIEEIFFSEKGMDVTPYTLPQSYARITMERIINQEPLESNVGVLVARAFRNGAGSLKKGRGSAGKALVSEGGVSFWISVPDEDYMRYFTELGKTGIVEPLGVTVRRDDNNTYGIALTPVLKGLSADYIPRCMKASLRDIAKNPDRYRSTGLLSPPVWVINVKIESAERFLENRDVRGR